MKAEVEVLQVPLTKEFFADCFVNDTVDLAKLSWALHASHGFLADFVFENGLGGQVAAVYEAAAAIVVDRAENQLTSHAAAA